MKEIKLTLKEARRFLVTYQGLHKKSSTNSSDVIMTIFSRLGCIQYDTLNVVGRNPDLVLQSRIANYSKHHLAHLLYTDRQLIDGWDKMMSIYPLNDWPNFYRVRESHGQGTIGSLQYRNSIESLDMTESIKQLIQNNGPQQAAKIKSDTTSTSLWGSQKQASSALDYLFSIGEIGIWNKANTQKIYDLIENIVPENILNIPEPFITNQAFIDWYVLRRINSIGLLWNKNGGGWLGYYTQKKAIRNQSLIRLLSENKIHKVTIESIKEVFYISSESLGLLSELISNKTKISKQVRFLAPLDNFMWDRDLIESIFDFNYRWEVYTPVVKRQYGYYVLPILYGYNLVGRIEFDYYRGEDKVKIINKWFEPTFKTTKSFEKAFNTELKNFTHYLKNSL